MHSGPLLNRFWIGTFCFLGSGYPAWIFAAQHLRKDDTFWITAPVLAVSFFACFVAAVRSKCPLKSLGLRLDRWQADCLSALCATAGILAMALIFKALWIEGTDKPLLAWSDHLSRRHFWTIPVYLMLIPMQDFIFRSCLQGLFCEMARNRSARILAVITASLIYSLSHWHISPVLVGITIVPGLIWGVLFYISGSLLAPVLSHMATGLIAFYIIGFHDFTAFTG